MLRLKIESVEDSLSPTECTIKETLGDIFHLEVSFVSPRLDLGRALLGSEATVWVTPERFGKTQLYHGLVECLKGNTLAPDGSRDYTIELTPWLSKLKRTRNARAFRNQSVTEITQQIFSEHELKDYTLKQLNKQYPPLDYVTQLNESSFDFLSRLWQEAGIYATFQHAEQHHTLALQDREMPLSYYEHDTRFQPGFDQGAHFFSWKGCVKRIPKTLVAQAFDRNNPSENNKAVVQQTATEADSLPEGTSNYYYGHGVPTQTDELSHFLAQQQKRDLLSANTTEVSGNYPHLAIGQQINLTRHTDQSYTGKYWIGSLEQRIHQPLPKSRDVIAEPPTYENTVKIYTQDLSYVPPITHEKPFAEYLSTAEVAGPEEQEIHTNEQGEVKVQLHNHRAANDPSDPSPFVPVIQALGGASHGTQWIPRTKQTVLLNFIQNDPDKPVVIGSLPHLNQRPAFDPEKTPAQSGFKTRSFGLKEGEEGGNEIRFDDTPGAEELYIKAQKDYKMHVKGNSKKHIKGNSSHTVQKGNWTVDAGEKYSLSSEKEICMTVGESLVKITKEGVLFQSPEIVTQKGTLLPESKIVPQIPVQAKDAEQKKSQDSELDLGDDKRIYPSAKIELKGVKASLGPLVLPPVTVMIESSLNASLQISNKKVVNPLIFSKESFEPIAKKEALKIFSGFKVFGPRSIMSSQPSLTLYNNQDDYKFTLTSMLVTENIKQFTGSLSKSAAIDDDDWLITGELTMEVTVTLTKQHPEGSTLTSLAYDLEHSLEQVKQALAAWGKEGELILTQLPLPARATLIVGVLLLTAPGLLGIGIVAP